MNRRYLSVGCAFVLALLGFVSCSIPLGEPSKTGRGSLGINIPRMASWVAEGQVASARAMAYATSVHVEILDSAGKQVIPLYKKSLATAAQDKLNIQIPDIPVGNNYTINVEVFNSIASDDDPVVRGSKKDVSVQAGKAVSVNIVCLPVEPEPLVVNPSEILTSSLSAGSEAWFKTDCTAGKNYIFSVSASGTPDFVCALYDSKGILINKTRDNSISYSAAATDVVYFALARSLQAENSKTFTFNVEEVPPPPPPTMFTVTFDTNGGSSVSSQTVETGTILATVTTTRAGHVFDGWFTTSSFETTWNLGTDTVNVDLTLYAKWLEIVTLTDVTGVPVPATGASAPSTFTTTEYLGGITWSPNHASFQAEQAYTATITLTAKPGFTFRTLTASDFKVNGTDPSSGVTLVSPYNTCTITHRFPPTGSQMIAFETLTADGSAAQTTTTLTLGFSQDPTGLSIDDISVIGASKGVLEGTGDTRTLTVYGISVAHGTDITVQIASPLFLPDTSRAVAINRKVESVGDIIYAGTVPVGVVFWVDGTGKYKMVSIKDVSTSLLRWHKDSTNNVAFTSSDVDGTLNVNAIKNSGKTYDASNFPAMYSCEYWDPINKTVSTSSFGWYLPAKDELSALFNSKAAVNTGLGSLGVEATQLNTNLYWSSSQYNTATNECWSLKFDGSTPGSSSRSYLHNVRAIMSVSP